MQVFAYLEGVIVLKLSPIIGVGDSMCFSFEHVGALRVIDKEGMWVKELDKYETSVLTMMQVVHRRVPSSRNRQNLETMIPVSILSCTGQLCARSST